MQVIFHCGAHGTEEDRLLKTLQLNKNLLKSIGTAVPGPKKYRSLIKERYTALLEGAPTTVDQESLSQLILAGTQADRAVLSNAHFFGSQRQSLESNQFYPEAETRVQAWQQMFPFDQLEIFLALRNPAALVPDLLKRASPQRKKEVLHALDPYQLRWSDLLIRLRQAAPNVPITIWCFEDMPMIWDQIIRDMTGIEIQQEIVGSMSLLSAIMTDEGIDRLQQYLGQHPNMTEIHKRRVIAAFLDKFADHEALEEEIDLPGWTENMIEALTDLYEEDMERVNRIPGVTLIAP